MDTHLEALGELPAAILAALAEAPAGEGVSLPRLTKRLGPGASVLMRQLTLMGGATIAGVAGPGLVQLTQQDGRWTATLTQAGRLFLLSGRGA